MELVRAISRTWISEYFMLVENTLWPADDPLVVARPELFTSDLEPIVNRSGPAVAPKQGRRTTATSEPVEARS